MLIRYFRMILLWLCFSSQGIALAIGAEQPLPDPAQEARAHQISKGLRCLVCQNQSIEDSNAELARDLRMVVRERISAGDSDDQVRAYLVARYGDWVLLKPPFKSTTYLLWVAPILLLTAALAVLVIYYRQRRKRGADPAALSSAETARLQAILDEAPEP